MARQLQPEDVAEPREPHVVQLIRPHSRVWKVQVVLMTLLELDGPLPRCRIGESRMQEVICGISQRPYRCVRAGPRENANVSTLEGVGLGCPLPSRPLHCGRWACAHEYTDDGMRSPIRNVPIARSTLATHVLPACVANDAEGTRNCPHTPYCMCMSRSMARSLVGTVADRWCVS